MNLKNTIIYYYTKLTYKIDKEEGLVQSHPFMDVFMLSLWVGALYGSFSVCLMGEDVISRSSSLELMSRVLYPVIYTLWVPLVLNLMPYLVLLTLTKEEKRSLEKRFIEEQKKVEEKENKIKQKQNEEKRWRKEQWKTHQQNRN